ncbi:LptF/LptG family permease [Flammeovirgaceae bacterium SG7u.111]|nr:LptF/LptG family permease [Flammeovirgaceae bacterium SG7u.132]WPO34313.1 LptF/LptG family permease [Flammeovirgaceae bacterium SG7u.111]
MLRLKKIDKLILKSFLGPFLLAFSVVLFIFLTQFMIKNFKHFVGKGLPLEVYGELFFYFSLVLAPVALPLGVLLSSLMTFGTLGEHSELTAIKSAGISLIRILWPVGIFVMMLTFGAFYFNDQLAPKANLKAWSLLYDIKQKKPTLEFKEEVFYTDLPGYRIKIDKKIAETDSLEGIMIYNHRDRKGNVQVIMAKRGTMRTVGDKYLRLDLQDGTIYSEESVRKGKKKGQPTEYFRNKFDSSNFMFSLSSYGMKDTKEAFFAGHNYMKTTAQLAVEKDSSQQLYDMYMGKLYTSVLSYHTFWRQDDMKELRQKQAKEEEERELQRMNEEERMQFEQDKRREEEDLKKTRQLQEKEPQTSDVQGGHATVQLAAYSPPIKDDVKPKTIEVDTAKVREIMTDDPTSSELVKASSKVGSIYNLINTNVERSERQIKLVNNYRVDIYRNFTKTVAVFVMFLIGAPLGAIIKKGGLGMPILISIVFFVIYYIATILGEKYAKEMVIAPEIGCWAANFILFLFGLFFLRQARRDARLFDFDFYYVVFSNVKDYVMGKKKTVEKAPQLVK